MPQMVNDFVNRATAFLHQINILRLIITSRDKLLLSKVNRYPKSLFKIFHKSL